MTKIISVIILILGAIILIPLGLFLLKFLLLLIAQGIIYVGVLLAIALVLILISNIFNNK